jgi:hypothetical protein
MCWYGRRNGGGVPHFNTCDVGTLHIIVTSGVFLTAVRWSFFNIYLKLQFQWQRDFSLPTIDHSRVFINNDGGTAEPLIDGSVLCNAFALQLSTACEYCKKLQ